jgi:mono/diheme cytochrome c family protein
MLRFVPRSLVAWFAGTAALVAAAGLGACEATLDEACTEEGGCGGEVQPSTATDSACDLNAQGLPTDVCKVLEANCQRCHTEPPLNGAPFPLLTFDDTQEAYDDTRKIWEVMSLAVEPGGAGSVPMPLGANPTDEASLTTLRAWFDTCRAGACDGNLVETSGASSSSSGGGCEFGDTGDLPCDVYRVLNGNCHRCHGDPLVDGAPFPLLTYADTQADFFTRPVWDRMADAVEPGAIPGMPFGANPMEEANIDVLRAWFATCDAGECAHAE